MKKSSVKLFMTALAFAACISTPVALVACGSKTEQGEQGGDSTTCTVRFDAGNGTIFGARFYNVTVENGSTVSAPSEKPVNGDYYFLGWNVTGSSSGEMFEFDSAKVYSDITLRAVWVEGFTVTFDANGGSFSEGADTYTIRVAKGSKLTQPDVTPPDANRVIKGWSDSYHLWDFDNGTVTRDITFMAQWEFSDSIRTALEPFSYTENQSDVCITGVKDKQAAVNLVVPSIATSISNNAFKDCLNLQSVTIADSIDKIPDGAFQNCAKLTTVSLPSALTEIGDRAFSGCSALETIDLPNSLTSIGQSAFRDCVKLKKAELPVGVTEISIYTFSGCSALQEVKFGANVDVLGSYAFQGCVSLGAITIPSKVTTLQSYLFSGCTSLQTLTVPATCTKIGSRAFLNCTGLTSVELHSETIDFGAFTGCASLERITFGAEVNEISSSFDGCTSLTEVEIPNTVTKLGSYAFKDCTALKSVDIGNGINTIGANAFNGCCALRDVNIGSGVTKIEGSAFANCISLLNFTIPAAVTEIGNDAFKGSQRLVEVYNLSAVTLDRSKASAVGLRALWDHGVSTYCVIHTSDSEESIIKKATGGFSFITLEVGSSSNAHNEHYLFDYSGSAENLVLPTDYEGNSYKVFKYALSCNPRLKSVRLPANVTAIGDEILFGSDNVTGLTVDSGNTVYESNGNCVISKADKMFVLGCRTSVIPADGSVTAIGSNVFCHNKNVVGEFKIPQSVTVVKSSAFSGCDGIIRTADNHIQYVDNWAVALYYDEDKYGDIYQVDSFDVTLDDGTVGISDSAFNVNTEYSARRRIKSVTTNAELKYIGDSAFNSCDFLMSVTLNDGLCSIGGSAFGSCSRLQEIVIPDSVTSIGSAAFGWCSELVYIKLPRGLTVIMHQMFGSCKKLESVVIQSGVSEIEYWSFHDCPSNPTVYFVGDSEQWNAIRKPPAYENDAVADLTVCYYSETAQTGCWHFDVEGKPTLW